MIAPITAKTRTTVRVQPQPDGPPELDPYELYEGPPLISLRISLIMYPVAGQ